MKNPISTIGVRNISGLTLIEMVVVLVILAALTGIAVRSIEPIAEQSRYEATQQTLINIDEALVRQTLTPDRVASYSGFVADIGRLPIPRGAAEETQLAELWSQADPVLGWVLPTFDVADFADGDLTGALTIPVAAGWRGPYLLLPPGPNELRDGFGRAFGIVVNGDTEIANVVSAGANGVVAGTDVGYDRDLELPGGLWTDGRYQGSITINLKELNGVDEPNLSTGETLRVRLYGPINGVASVLAEASSAEATIDGAQTFSEMIVDQTIGPRAIVGYVTTGAMAPYTVVRQTAIKQIVLAPGMNPSMQLDLNPAPSP